MRKKILRQDQKEKSSRLRSQPRNNYKTFFPQSKVLKKIEFQKRNQNTDKNKKPKPIQQKDVVHQTYPKPETKKSQKERKKTLENILPQDQKGKSEHREASRLRSQPRNNYETFIPQSKILKKVEFQQQIQV